MAHSGGHAALTEEALSKAVSEVVEIDWSETVMKMVEVKLKLAKELINQVEQRYLSTANEEYLMMLNGVLTSLMKFSKKTALAYFEREGIKHIMAAKNLRLNEYVITMKTNYSACLYQMCKYSDAVDVLRKLVSNLENDVYPMMQLLKEEGKTEPDHDAKSFQKKVSRLCLNYKLLSNAMHLSGRSMNSGSKQHSAVDVLKRATKLCHTYAENPQLLASLQKCLETLTAAHEESVINLRSGVFSAKGGKDLRSSAFRISGRQDGHDSGPDKANDSKMSKIAISSSKSWKTSKEPVQAKSQTQLATQDSKTPSMHSKATRGHSHGVKHEFRVKTKTGSSASKNLSDNTALKDIFSGLVQIKVEPNISIITGGKPLDGKMGPIKIQRIAEDGSSSKKFRIRDASDGKSEAGSSRIDRMRQDVYSKQRGRHHEQAISESDTYSEAPQSFSESGYKNSKKTNGVPRDRPLTTETMKLPPRKRSDSTTQPKDQLMSHPHIESQATDDLKNAHSSGKGSNHYHQNGKEPLQQEESLPRESTKPQSSEFNISKAPTSKHVTSELYNQEPGKKPMPIIPGLSPVQKPTNQQQTAVSPSANYGINVAYSQDMSMNNTQNNSHMKDLLGSVKAVESQQNNSRDISNSGADALQDSIVRSSQKTAANAPSKDKSGSTVSQKDGTPKHKDRIIASKNVIVPDDGIVHLKILRDIFQRKYVGVAELLKHRLLTLLEDYFDEDAESFSIFSPTIPDGDYEVTVRMMIMPKKTPVSSDSNYEVELQLFDPADRQKLIKDFGGFTNKPILTNLEYILNILDKLPYDWSIHWSNALTTFPSLVQYLNSVIIPFLDIDKDPASKEIFPDLVPTPGNIIPEIVTKFRGQECFIGCYHVNDNNIRIVVNTMLKQGQAVQESRKLAMIDVELESDSFYDLIELTTQMDEGAFQDYRKVIGTIKKAKETKFGGSGSKFKDWLGPTLQNEEKDWLDLYLRQALEVKIENTEKNSQALVDLMQQIVAGVGAFYDQPTRQKPPSGPAEPGPSAAAANKPGSPALCPQRWFFTKYIEEYDEYMLMSFQEAADLSKSHCFFIDWAIISPENKDKPIKLNKEDLIEVSRCRFNQDFGLDFRLLREDEKPFFFQAYSRILAVRKRDDEEGNYSVNLGAYRVESVRYAAQGEAYRIPLSYQLLSDGKSPIAVVVSTFNEFLVWKVGAVAAINPHSVCEPFDNDVQGGSPEGEQSSLSFIKDMLQTIGWDVIQAEVKVEGGIPHFRKGHDRVVFESFDNLINLNRCRQIADELEPGWENTDSASSETN